MPFDLYLKALHRRSVLRLQRLPFSHILVTSSTPHPGHTPANLLAYAAYIRQPHVRPDLPLQELLLSKSTTDEEFAPAHTECEPGVRVVDVFEGRIIHDTRAPPKADEEAFQAWINSLRAKLARIQGDHTQAYAFADGSVVPKQQSRSAAAFRAFKGRTQTARRAVSTGKCVSYDAEAFAIRMALGHRAALTDVTDIHVFADNRAALDAIFDTSMHASQAISYRRAQPRGHGCRPTPAVSICTGARGTPG